MAVPQVPTTAAEPPGPAPTGRSPPYDGLVSVPRQSRRLSGGLPVGQGPFGRLALTHVLAVGGDALVAMALAGSLFFSVDPAGARWRIFLYLVFTMAPFAVVGPLIGPAMDRARGGRRTLLIGSTIGRVVVAVLMVGAVSGNSLLVVPEAFVMLILAKSYQVAKAAIVPTVVDGDAALVEANSKLQLLSGLAGFAVGLPGLIALWIGPGAVMVLAAIMFTLASIAAFRLPRIAVAPDPAGPAEVAELRSGAVLSAGSAMGTLRGVVGLVTFLMAFALRGGGRITEPGEVLGRVSEAWLNGPVTASDLAPPGTPPPWHFAVIVAVSVAGGLAGAAIAPILRKGAHEEYLLLGSVGLAACAGVAGMLFSGLFGQALLAGGIAVGASAGKQAFDAVVQRDAPDANRGRIFARFESRFQVAWVCGAVVPVVIPLPTQWGGLIVACLATAAALLYMSGMRAVQRGEAPPQLPTAREVHGHLRGRLGRRRPGATDGAVAGPTAGTTSAADGPVPPRTPPMPLVPPTSPPPFPPGDWPAPHESPPT